MSEPLWNQSRALTHGLGRSTAGQPSSFVLVVTLALLLKVIFLLRKNNFLRVKVYARVELACNKAERREYLIVIPNYTWTSGGRSDFLALFNETTYVV